MNHPKDLFTIGEQMQHQAMLKHTMVSASKAPLLYLYAILQALAVSAIAFIEWEIIYEVFVYLSGDGEGYWAPEIMGCTAAVMVVGFHLLAKTEPNNLAVRIVNTSVSLLIPAYLFGVGLLIAGIMYSDGLGDLVSTSPVLALGSLPQAIEQGWLETFYENYANPTSTLVFSLGIGGLAVINIFVAHRLLVMITQNLSIASQRITNAKEALKDHSIIKTTQKEYAHLALKLDELEKRNDAYIRMLIANDVVAAISEALHPHKIWLKEQAINKPSRFEEDKTVNHSAIAKEVSKIEAISLADVLAALKPKCLEKLS